MTFTSLEAKEVAIGNTDINDDKADTIMRLHYFSSRQQLHCKK